MAVEFFHFNESAEIMQEKIKSFNLFRPHTSVRINQINKEVTRITIDGNQDDINDYLLCFKQSGIPFY